MKFLHPELNKPVRAIFYGLERPQPISPRPTNLQVGMAHLDLSETSLTGDFELVQLTLNFGKHMKKPLRCDIQKKQNLKTGWGDWEYLADVNAFECQWYDKILRCLSLPDGVEVVEVLLDSRLPKPVYFQTSGRSILYTKAERWLFGRNGSFFVFLDSRTFYLTYSWPKEDLAFE